jgi:hypothetical protein
MLVANSASKAGGNPFLTWKWALTVCSDHTFLINSRGGFSPFPLKGWLEWWYNCSALFLLSSFVFLSSVHPQLLDLARIHQTLYKPAQKAMDKKAVPSTNAEGPPRYERPPMGSLGAETADGTASPSTKGNGITDRKANYALALQKTCGVALQRVKNSNVIANTNWAAPLAAAPSAISTMAILLKTADLKAAAGLEVESQEVKADDGTAVGHLP